MTKLRIASTASYAFVILVTAAMGTKFLAANEYFAYHAAASGVDWSSVDAGLQAVFIALLRVCGAGFITVATCLAVLLIVPFAMRNRLWAIYALPATGLVFWSIVLTTTAWITRTTPATAPWQGSLTIVIAILVAFALSLAGRARVGAARQSAAADVNEEN